MPWDLTQFFQSPSAAPSYFPESHQWPGSEISSLSKVILVLGKARSPRAPNLGCRVAASVLPQYFECDSHTVHMLTQQHLPPPLTNTVKSSSFTHAHSSALFLAARLHQCHANHSHYINNGWTFSKQTLFFNLSNFEAYFHLFL